MGVNAGSRFGRYEILSAASVSTQTSANLESKGSRLSAHAGGRPTKCEAVATRSGRSTVYFSKLSKARLSSQTCSMMSQSGRSRKRISAVQGFT
jgi:hypothetical protein